MISMICCQFYCVLWVFCAAAFVQVTLSQTIDEINTTNTTYFDIKFDEGSASITLFKSDGTESELLMEEGDNVRVIMRDLCSRVHIADCARVTDMISYAVYRDEYSPSLAHATREDFKTSRIDFLRYIAESYSIADYLEIGTASNEVFNVIRSLVPHAVGVDPKEGGTLRMTSDEFFATNTQTFDLVFVDGLHEGNQAFRDVHNALKVLKPGGIILMHDCNPTSAAREQPQLSGDAWKAAVALRLRTDIEIVLLDIDCGIGVIKRRENKHPLPPEWIAHLDVNPISMLSYDLYEQHKYTLHRFMTLSDVRQWLAE